MLQVSDDHQIRISESLMFQIEMDPADSHLNLASESAPEALEGTHSRLGDPLTKISGEPG
jgi:hypothetical protein